MGDGRQDRVHQADAHERHDACERDGEDGFRLPKRARDRACVGAAHAVLSSRGLSVSPLRASQRVDGRQRRGERRLVLRADPGQDYGESLGSHGPAAAQHLPPHLGQPDLDDPSVGGVRVPADQPGILQPGDQLGHGRLGHALLDGERGEPPWPRPLQGGQRRGRGQGQAVRRAQRPEQPDQPLQPSRDPGRQRRLRPASASRPSEISISNLYHILMLSCHRPPVPSPLEPVTLPERFARRVGSSGEQRPLAVDVGERHNQSYGGPCGPTPGASRLLGAGGVRGPPVGGRAGPDRAQWRPSGGGPDRHLRPAGPDGRLVRGYRPPHRQPSAGQRHRLAARPGRAVAGGHHADRAVCAVRPGHGPGFGARGPAGRLVPRGPWPR